MEIEGIVLPSQNTNVYHMVVECSQMFANIKHGITVFNEHLFDVCENSSKCGKCLCLAGYSSKYSKFALLELILNGQARRSNQAYIVPPKDI